MYKHPGILDFQPSPDYFLPHEIGGISVTSLPLNHSKITQGYHFQVNRFSLAYLTDTLGIPEKTHAFLQNNRPNIMVLDCNYPPKKNPKNHNSLNEALDIHHTIQPERTYLTHISCELDFFLQENRNYLPNNVFIAKDNDIIPLPS